MVLPESERLEILLADRALFGLSLEEEAELDFLLAGHPNIDADGFDRLAAHVDLAFQPTPYEPLPDAICAKIRRQAMRSFSAEKKTDFESKATAGVIQLPPSTRKSGVRQAFGWLIAAATMVAAISFWYQSAGTSGSPATIAQLRAQVARGEPGIINVDWQSTGDSTASVATGDVIWSNSRQEGFMRFRALEKNNPAEFQYQLWIFDADRDERYPVDGGVFDIAEDESEVIVPIRAKLKVIRPSLFAVTVEQPGGVVVSNRERICLLAKLDN